MFGNRYVEFALACGSAVGAGGDRSALFSVVEACAVAYSDAESRSSGSVGDRSEVERFEQCSVGTRLDSVRAAFGRVVGEFGGSGSGCCEQVVGGNGRPVESSGVMDLSETEDCVVGAASSSGGFEEGKGLSTSAERVRGKNYVKNKHRREAAKAKRARMQSSWWRVNENRGCGSSSVAGVPTVCTVGTAVAVEVEAARTLAERRVAENKVAVALAGHKLRVLQDKSRTEMVDRLAAARAEQRINDAKAKSQASFKKCDESLKSLGSSGSAGEFALKLEIRKAKEDKKIKAYIEKQAQMYAKYATPEVQAMVARIPPPDLNDAFDDFGECSSDCDEDQRQAYYDELNRQNEESYDPGFAQW